MDASPWQLGSFSLAVVADALAGEGHLCGDHCEPERHQTGALPTQDDGAPMLPWQSFNSNLVLPLGVPTETKRLRQSCCSGRIGGDP